MSRAQKLILGLLAALACGLSATVGSLTLQAVKLYTGRPLSPSLPLPQTSLPTTPAISPVTVAEPTAFAPMEAPRCGGPASLTVLAIGTDARSDSYQYGLADVIRLVRFDFVEPRVAILDVPRDLWVEIPEIQDDIGQDHEKLNQAYLYGNPGFGYYDHPSAGPGLLARTLLLNFGLQADRYVAVNMRTFEKIVNAVGGIDIRLEDSIDGRTREDRSRRLLFTAGDHHLNGAQALTFARIRNEGTFARTGYQDLVMCALRDRLLSPDVITRAPDLIDAFYKNVQTDLSIQELGQLACLSSQLPSENLRFAEFPGELFKQGRIYDPVFKKRVFIWDTDLDSLREYSARFGAGEWPTAATVGAPEQPGFECP